MTFAYPVNHGEMTRDGIKFSCAYCDRIVIFDGYKWKCIKLGDPDARHHYGMKMWAEVKEEK